MSLLVIIFKYGYEKINLAYQINTHFPKNVDGWHSFQGMDMRRLFYLNKLIPIFLGLVYCIWFILFSLIRYYFSIHLSEHVCWDSNNRKIKIKVRIYPFLKLNTNETCKFRILTFTLCIFIIFFFNIYIYFITFSLNSMWILVS